MSRSEEEEGGQQRERPGMVADRWDLGRFHSFASV